jgi:hypothetical protein
VNQINYIQNNHIEIIFDEIYRIPLHSILNRKLESKYKYFIWVNSCNEKQLKDFIIKFENNFDIDERVIDFLIEFKSDINIKTRDIPIPYENQLLIDNFLLNKYGNK